MDRPMNFASSYRRASELAGKKVSVYPYLQFLRNGAEVDTFLRLIQKEA